MAWVDWFDGLWILMYPQTVKADCPRRQLLKSWRYFIPSLLHSAISTSKSWNSNFWVLYSDNAILMSNRCPRCLSSYFQICSSRWSTLKWFNLRSGSFFEPPRQLRQEQQPSPFSAWRSRSLSWRETLHSLPGPQDSRRTSLSEELRQKWTRPCWPWPAWSSHCHKSVRESFLMGPWKPCSREHSVGIAASTTRPDLRSESGPSRWWLPVQWMCTGGWREFHTSLCLLCAHLPHPRYEEV